MKTTTQLLVEARANLSCIDHLVRGRPACDADGRPVAPTSPMARRWCSTGAILKAANGETGENLETAISVLQFAMDGNIPNYHDTHTHREILEKFDFAISITSSLDPIEVTSRAPSQRPCPAK